jgi:hypothetical protein
MSVKTPRLDLGWANGWAEKPAEVLACQAKGHRMTSQDIAARKNTLYSCDECGIQYHVDSSD